MLQLRPSVPARCSIERRCTKDSRTCTLSLALRLMPLMPLMPLKPTMPLMPLKPLKPTIPLMPLKPTICPPLQLRHIHSRSALVCWPPCAWAQVHGEIWDPYPIFVAVADRGGAEAVTAAGLWRDVAGAWSSKLAESKAYKLHEVRQGKGGRPACSAGGVRKAHGLQELQA